jgi:hypothetical protein
VGSLLFGGGVRGLELGIGRVPCCVRLVEHFLDLRRRRLGLCIELGSLILEVGDGQAPSARAKMDQRPGARALRRSWAKLIKRIYEIDPLVCLKCGSEMKVVAFIVDHVVVDKILGHVQSSGVRRPLA